MPRQKSFRSAIFALGLSVGLLVATLSVEVQNIISYNKGVAMCATHK